MNFKKKAAVTTLAASLVVGSIAGLPLSTQGALNKLGISNVALAYDSAPLNNTTIVNELQNIHNNLDSDGITAVQTARNNLIALNPMDPANQSLIADLTAKISARVATSTNPSAYTLLTPNNVNMSVFSLINSLGLFYFSDGREVTYFITNDSNRQILDQLAKLGGVGGIDGAGVTVADASTIATELQTAIGNAMTTNFAQLAPALLGGGSSAKAIAKTVGIAALKDVLSHSQTKVAAVLNSLTKDEKTSLETTATNIANKVDPGNKARLALAVAAVRAHSAVTQIGNTSEDGRTKTFQYTVLGQAMPVSALNITTSNSIVTVTKNTSNNTLTLQNTSFGAASTGVTITLNASGTSLDKKQLFTNANNAIILNTVATGSSGGGVGGGGGGGSSSVQAPSAAEVGKIVSSAQNDIKATKDKLKDATPTEKAQIIADLREKIAESIAQIANLDISNAIKVDKDTAKVSLDTSAIVNQIKDIVKQAKDLNDQLKALDPNAAPADVELKLDLGKLKVNGAEIPLSKDILKAAKDNGVDKIAIQANGVAVAFNPATFSADTTLSMKKDDAKIATAATKQQVASDVYEFEFSSGGKKVTSFSQAIELRFPVSNDKVDKELLTLAKIDNGKIIVYGGKYDANSKEFAGKRTGLSTYTVIENKVTFKDTASVKDWAGRPIEVVAAKGIVDGRADGQFVPNDTVTRAEFAKMIVTAFGLEDSSAKATFSDVSDKDWFKTYVASAVKAGIVNGRSADQFDPNGQITRAEMATMASRALVATGNFKYEADASAALKGFKDADGINSSLKDGVALAAELGIVVGEDGGQFNPNDDSTRAQAAVVIYRLLNKQ